MGLGSVDEWVPDGLTAASERDPARLDLNAIGFEELRGLGLSVVEALRFLAGRERLGRLESAAELEGITGLSEEATLKLLRAGRL